MANGITKNLSKVQLFKTLRSATQQKQKYINNTKI